METMKRVVLISILLLCLGAPMNAQAQGTPIGVDIECDQQNVEINVHPEQNSPVNVGCTVSNTGSFNQKINIDSTVDGNGFTLVLSESSFDLAAGEDGSFIATFSASPRMDVLSADYNITATVESFGQEPIMVPLGQFGSTSESSGQVSSLPYSRLSFQIQDTSTIVLSEPADDDDGFYEVELTLFNDGNFDDDIKVEIVNLNELSDLGIAHSFYSVSPIYAGIDFYREVVPAGVTSQSGILVFGIDELPAEGFTFEIDLHAYSLSDDNAQDVELSLEVQVEGSESSGGAFGLETVSNNDLKIVGLAGAGLFGIILLLVLISRLTKKAGKQKIAAKQAKKAAKAQKRAGKSRRKKAKKVVEYEDEIDDDFDDDFDDFDDDFDFDDL